MMQEKVLVIRSGLYSIWGEVMKKNKLARYEVRLPFGKVKGPYSSFAEAEKVYNAAIAEQKRLNEKLQSKN